MLEFTRFEKLKMLIWNIYLLPGLFVIIVISVIFIKISPLLDLHSMSYKSHNVSLVKATLNNFKRVSNNKVYKYNYSYKVGRVTYNGISYGRLPSLDVNNSVSVEYLNNKPEVSRIKNTRNGVICIEIFVVCLFFLIIGITFSIIPLFRRYQIIKLLESDFELVSTTLISKSDILPNFLIGKVAGMLTEIPLYGFEFQYIKNGKTNKIFVHRIDRLCLNENEQYMAIVNPNNSVDIHIVEFLPNIIKYYMEC